MKFFFPDSQDQIDPGFNFTTEEYSADRRRQHDDRYAHETLAAPAYDGLLVSKSIVDGTRSGSGKYTLAQRHRLYRVGVGRFFRLRRPDGRTLVAMGDCGAFGYVAMELPPYTVDEVIDYYEACGFDLGLSLDHVVLAYVGRDQIRPEPADARRRRDLTLALAAEFRQRCRERKVCFTPIGVAQGWSAQSMAESVDALQRMGYRRIALGGMVPLKTPDLIDCLQAVDAARDPGVELHLLGVTRTDHVERFAQFGVTSFDSTSAFRQAFKDDRDNYYTLDGSFTAVRVPQVGANPTLKKRIAAGQVDQRVALEAETIALARLRGYAHGSVSLDMAVDALRAYELIHTAERDRSTEYEAVLRARPWEECDCGICAENGIDVVIFRGAERNKRRGFHNLAVFAKRLARNLRAGLPTEPRATAL